MLRTLLVVLIVGSTVGPAFSGPAVADDDFEDDVTETLTKCGQYQVWFLPSCINDNIIIDGDTDEEYHWDIYSSGLTTDSSRRQYTTETESKADQTSALAISEAKFEIIKSLNNGSSKAEAKKQGRDAVNDIFSTNQRSIYNSQNRQAQDVRIAYEEFANSTDLRVQDVYPGMTNIDKSEARGSNFGLLSKEQNVTLWNGKNMSVLRLQVVDRADKDGDGDVETVKSQVTYYSDQIGDYHNGWGGESNLNIKSPTGRTVIPLDAEEYNQSVTTLSTARDQALDNVDQLGDDIYRQYEPGDIDLEDATGPLEQTLQTSTDYDSTGHYSYVLAQAAETGMSTNVTSSMTITYKQTVANATNHTIEGSLYAEPGAFEPYNGTIDTNQMYNTSNLTGQVWAVAQYSASTEEISLNGTFVVESMTNALTGESINSTHMQDNQFSTTNATKINEQIREILEDRRKVDQTGPSAGSGDADASINIDFGEIFKNAGIGALVALLLVFLVAYKFVEAY